ncbi:MAG: hypothetical protein ACRESW_04070, partial [Nevskiales bacterium]
GSPFHSLEVMFELPCPWCKANLRHAQLGGRRTEHKWRSFSLYPSFILVCPYCNGAVRRSKQSMAWLLLTLPTIYIVGLLIARQYDLVFPVTKWHWMAVGITVIGMLGFEFSERFEKVQ